MNPLIAIAASLLPEIVKSLVGEKDREKAGAIADSVAKAVKDAAGTDDPAAAQNKIASDPAVAADLRIKLAQIAAEQEEKKRQAGLDELKTKLDEAERVRQDNLAQLHTKLEDEARQRADEMKELQTRLADTGEARSTYAQLAEKGNWGALGAPLVSLIVTAGFLALVVLLVLNAQLQQIKEGPALQLLNVMFGTFATAFATVVSFWLGSSEGSRRKDVAAFALQRQQAQQTADIVRSSSAQAGDVIRAQGTKNTPQPAATKASAPAGGARSNFNKCLDLVLVYEGGFSNHPADPGGATNLGITKATLEHWRKETVSVEDVKALKVEEAAEIYRSNYWNALNCSALPAGVDLIVFDFGVNAGPSRSAKLLQKAVGANQDGSIGPATLAAVTASLPADIIQSMTAGRLDFYRGLPGWETFKNGWTRRTNDIAKAALAMALG